MPKSLQGPGERGTSLGLLGRDPTQGFHLINQQPKSDLKPPKRYSTPAKKESFNSINKPQNLEYQKKATTEATQPLPGSTNKHTSKAPQPRGPLPESRLNTVRTPAS